MACRHQRRLPQVSMRVPILTGSIAVVRVSEMCNRNMLRYTENGT